MANRRDAIKQKMKPDIQKRLNEFNLNEFNQKRSIDIGKFLQSMGWKIVLGSMTFV